MRPPKSSFRGFHKALADLYDGFGNNITLAAADIPDFSEDVWKRLVEYIFVAKAFTPDMLSAPDVRSAIDETCRILTQGVDSAIKQKVPQELIDHLHNDTFLFSGFKTYHEAREISSLLLDPTTGSFKSFDKFFEEVRSIHERYNQNYLRAEYNFAVQSTQMAVRWHKFEQDGDRYLLQYRTANDGLVRPEHQALHNTTLPIGDQFWNDYTPPLGWNCRCTVVQVNRGKYPESDSAAAIRAGEEATAKPKQQIFRFNPGKTERIFPPKHPYFPKGCGDCQYRTSRRLGYKPDNPMCQACNTIAGMVCKENSRKLTKDEKVALRREKDKWVKENLPLTWYEPEQKEIRVKIVNGVEFRSEFYKELLWKNRNNKRLAKTFELSTEFEKWMPQMTYVRTEDGRHHPCPFNVYETTYHGYRIQMVAMVLDKTIIAHNFQIL